MEIMEGKLWRITIYGGQNMEGKLWRIKYGW